MIVKGIREIVSRYDVDGIHFDDYFYVSGMADQLDIVSRKNNVNALVSQVYSTIKSIKPSCTFGISPAGNPDNARSQGADIDTWLSTPGYIDYIMPQIYWTDVYMTANGAVPMFSNRCSAWTALNKQQLPMYAGLALYRVGTNSKTDLGWAASDTNLAYQYVTAKQLGYDGYALFRYQWLEKEIAAAEKIVRAMRENADKGVGVFTVDGKMIDVAFLPGAERTINWPRPAVSTRGDL